MRSCDLDFHHIIIDRAHELARCLMMADDPLSQTFRLDQMRIIWRKVYRGHHLIEGVEAGGMMVHLQGLSLMPHSTILRAMTFAPWMVSRTATLETLLPALSPVLLCIRPRPGARRRLPPPHPPDVQDASALLRVHAQLMRYILAGVNAMG